MSLGHCLSVIFLVLQVLLVSSRHIQLAYAKPSFTPVSTGGSASIFVEGKAFYIQAGISNQSMTRQVFKISLDTRTHFSPNSVTPFNFPSQKDALVSFLISLQCTATNLTYYKNKSRANLKSLDSLYLSPSPLSPHILARAQFGPYGDGW